MAIEPLYEDFQAGYLKVLGTMQVVAEAKLKPHSGANIAKILTVNAESSASSCEPLDGEARFGGTVNFKVLFVDEEGGLQSMDYNAAFSGKLESPLITPSLGVSATAETLDTETVAVAAGELKISCVIGVEVAARFYDNVKYLSEGSDGVHTQTEAITYDTISASVKEEFLAEEEFAAKDDMSIILLCEPSLVPKVTASGLDCFVFGGTVSVNVIYLTTDGRIRNEVLSADYQQELSGDGARVQDKVWSKTSIVKFDAVLESELGSDKKLLKCSYVLCGEAYAVAETQARAVTDAYCVDHEIRIVGESFKVNKFLGCFRFDERVEGNAALPTDLPGVDTILSVCASRINVANAYASKGRITLEGVVSTGIIYLNSETESRNSVQVELPYSLTVDCAAATENTVVEANACIRSINARPRNSFEIEISAAAVFTLRLYDEHITYVIKEISIGEEKKLSNSALTVYIVKPGEGVWELAKALSTTPEVIMDQNPEMKTPLTGGEKVLLYRQLK